MAAARLNVSEASLRAGMAGTEMLTKIRQGRRIFLDRYEVDRHIERKIKAAREQQRKYRYENEDGASDDA
jgi:hypothetical protein